MCWQVLTHPFAIEFADIRFGRQILELVEIFCLYQQKIVYLCSQNLNITENKSSCSVGPTIQASLSDKLLRLFTDASKTTSSLMVTFPSFITTWWSMWSLSLESTIHICADFHPIKFFCAPWYLLLDLLKTSSLAGDRTIKRPFQFLVLPFTILFFIALIMDSARKIFFPKTLDVFFGWINSRSVARRRFGTANAWNSFLPQSNQNEFFVAVGD